MSHPVTYHHYLEQAQDLRASDRGTHLALPIRRIYVTADHVDVTVAVPDGSVTVRYDRRDQVHTFDEI